MFMLSSKYVVLPVPPHLNIEQRTKNKLSGEDIDNMTKTNIDDSLGEQFPAADAETALNPGNQKEPEVDPVSSELESSILKKKERAEASHEKKRQKDAMQAATTAILISGIVVAVAGALFAVVKKLREKNK